MNHTLEVINKRVSLRRFAERPISQEHTDIIIQSAMRAPTAGNMMLYSILQVEDQAKKDKLSITCDNQPFIAKAPLILIFLADMQRWNDYYHYCGVKEYCERKGMLFLSPDQASLMLSVNDALIAAQNSVIAAESLGIGSCYIGDIMENYEIHQEMFNLPNYVFPAAMLCYGYYPEEMKRRITSRFDKEYILFKDNYRQLKNSELEEMFRERAKQFPENNKYDAQNFGQYMYGRKTGSDFIQEMARSIKVAMKNWQE